MHDTESEQIQVNIIQVANDAGSTQVGGPTAMTLWCMDFNRTCVGGFMTGATGMNSMRTSHIMTNHGRQICTYTKTE